MVRTELSREITQTDATQQLWDEAFSILAIHQQTKKDYSGNERLVETPDLHIDSINTHDFLYLSGDFTQGNMSGFTFETMSISPRDGVNTSVITMREGQQIPLEHVQKMRARLAFLNAGLNEGLDLKIQHRSKRSATAPLPRNRRP